MNEFAINWIKGADYAEITVPSGTALKSKLLKLAEEKPDEEHRSPLDLEECPEGHPYCTGDCFYYSEDPEERIAKGEEHWDLE